jgi:hypothetical protein
MFVKIKYLFARVLLKLCSPGLNPKIRLGDKIWALRMFTRAHQRLPSRNKLIFNDVLYRIKTSDELLNPLRVLTSDKELVKIYIKAIVGNKYNVPTIKILQNIQDVLSYKFPEKCCIKPTHLSARIILRIRNEKVNINEIKKWFNLNYYKSSREISYKNLIPKVIVEPLIFNSDPKKLLDFKVFCFNGQPKMIQVDFDRHTSHSRNLYDIKWNELPYSTLPSRKPNALKKPKNLKKMLQIASKLSQPFSFVRIDFYNNNEKILVGEITHCHGNAAEFFYPRSAEIEASNLIFGSNLDNIQIAHI